MIKAIETRYAGYQFRSRLEARWAVAFDASRPLFDWEYEPQGFDLDGIAYLPDFRIRWTSEDHSWVEVKPPGFTPSDRDNRIYAAMAQEPGPVGGLYLLGSLDAGYRLYRSDGTWTDTPEPFLELAAIVAGKSARFEHGRSGA